MLWFRKRSAAAVPVPVEEIAPAELAVVLDVQLFKLHYSQLVALAAEDGGIESHVAALGAKQTACAAALDLARSGGLGMDDIERLLAGVFTARRRLYPAFEKLGAARVSALIAALLDGAVPVERRLQGLADAMPGAASADRESLRNAAKLRRAAWDFAADVLHYADPSRYPLMTRWVWDESAQSGALREFVRGGDAMRDIPLAGNAAVFEAARRWLAQRIAEEGIYRDVPLWVDLVQAQAYVGYLRSVTEGSLGGDFGRGTPPAEQLRKLLGIDAAPASGRSRVLKRAAA